MAARRRRFRSAVPAGYYFVLDPQNALVYLTDAEYFDRTGFQSDWHISATIAIPTWLEEISEGIFSSSLSREETVESLLRHGFKTSEAFMGLMLGGRPNIRTINLSAFEEAEEQEVLQESLEPARPWYERLSED